MAAKKVQTAKRIALEPTMKIVVNKVAAKELPFREGTDTWKRVQAVLSAKTIEQAIKKGARNSTVRNLVRAKIIRTAA